MRRPRTGALLYSTDRPVRLGPDPVTGVCGSDTALHRAALKGHVDIIELLVQSNATVEAQADNG